ncbi:MAG: ribonuclease Z [Ruminococcus sp.]|nr:ribonuclease Z [Ruminococcus sp.]
MPEICLLGTGGMLPLKNRWLTSCYIEHNGRAVLIDCGEGTQIAFAEHGLKLSRVDILLLTHAHADHVTGLPGLLLSMGNCSRTEPLEVVMPKSCYNTFLSLMNVCGKLPYEVRTRTLPDKEPSRFKAEVIDPMLTVSSLPLKHSMPCLGYRLDFARKPVFLPENARALGVPVEHWRTLHAGQEVTLPDGRVISPSDVTGRERPDTVITYTTDTLPIGQIADFAAGSDLFICEGMYGDPDKKESMDKKGHMLMQDACRLAASAGAKRLWLTHYSPAEPDPTVYRRELERIFPGVVISRDGERCDLSVGK